MIRDADKMIEISYMISVLWVYTFTALATTADNEKSSTNFTILTKA